MQELAGANKDFLTHCYTRDSLHPFLNLMETEYRLNQKPFSALIIDVDRFKYINDKFGHLCGDEVLKYFSSSIRLDLEAEANAPFRFGGDEFIIVFPGKTAKETYRLAERLRKNIKMRPCLYKGRNIKMSFSGGIASYPHDAGNNEELLEKADQALYASKKAGRGHVVMFHTMKTRTAILLSTAAAGILLTFFALYQLREPAFLLFDDAKMKIKEISLRSPIKLSSARPAAPAVSVPVIPAPAEVPAAGAPEPLPAEKADKIYLLSGRVLEGKILSETEEAVRIEIKFKDGSGSLGIQKKDIARIERSGE